MSELTLLADESVLMSSDNDVLTLTNLRVRLNESASGQSQLMSVMLDSVASCGLVTRSHPILILLAVLAAVAGVFEQGNTQTLLLVTGVALAVAYAITRSAVLTIMSTGGSQIAVPAKGMSRAKIIAFIDELEKAKVAFARRCNGVA